MRARHRLEIIRRVERPLPPPVASLPPVAEPSWQEVMLSELTLRGARATSAGPPRPVEIRWGAWDPDIDPGEEDTIDPLSDAA